MSSDRHTAIPLGALPDPALAYAVDGDDARVTATNDAFERRFEPGMSGRHVSTILDRFDRCETTGDRDPLVHLTRGDQVGIRLDGREGRGPFFVRVVPSDDDTGYLVFSDLSECPERGGSPGVDRVSSVISHDLRNPLDVAKAHLRAARETGDAEHFESVADAHDRMERIIRDVLTLTRDDSVVRSSERVPVEVAARDAWQSMDTESAELVVTGSLPTVTADPDRLRRLFENLFRNSVEHGAPGERTESVPGGERRADDRSDAEDREAGHGVTVTVQPSEDGFCVADDGPGIPPTEREIAFDPGYSTRADGTGLGLAIVERIVEAHGWDVELTTADGGGARFEIRT